jgi:hypothetical protein
MRFLLFGFIVLLAACGESIDPSSIDSAPVTAPAFVGAAASPQPLTAPAPPIHPHMAAPGMGYMHADGYSSGSYPWPGPLGIRPQVLTRDGSRLPGGMCAVHTVTRNGQLLVLCASLLRFELHLLDAQSLRLLARFELPGRPSSFHALITLDPGKIMADTSGAYFYLDDQDRVVIADSRQRIQRIAHREVAPGQWQFELADSWDLSAEVPHDCVRPSQWWPSGECDPITAVMPDYRGLIWWVTRHGRLGTLDPASGTVRAMQLAAEEIQNGFSVAADGVYIVSDHAMYGFTAAATDGSPQLMWRETYDRGTRRKVGSINQGSGTTPTLLGDDYVTITDNADGQINLLVYRRRPEAAGERLICKLPLFQPGASATDNSAIGYGRSIIMENNAGYSSAIQQRDWETVAGGTQRIDIRADESGCDIVWSSRERSPSTVPKLSAANGLIYLYTFEPQDDGDNAWYLTALEFATGSTVFKVRTGAGSAFDNNWAPISLAPDGSALVGVMGGLVVVRDQR